MIKTNTYIKEITRMVRNYPNDIIDGILMCDINDIDGRTITDKNLILSLIELEPNGILTVVGTDINTGKNVHNPLSTFSHETIKKIWGGLCVNVAYATPSERLTAPTMQLAEQTKKEFDTLVNKVLSNPNLDANINPKSIIAAVCEKLTYDLIEHRAEIYDEKDNVLEMLAK